MKLSYPAPPEVFCKILQRNLCPKPSWDSSLPLVAQDDPAIFRFIIPQKSVATFLRCGKLKSYCEPSFFILRLAMVLPMVAFHRRVPLIQALS